ncbi:MAG: ArsR/SmtB family transcription factor [Bacteroidota bacterium]
MGASKSELFSANQNQLAVYAKALAHPARIAILQHLLKIETCICGDLVQELGLAQATISQHLRELKNAGIIQGNIEGTSVCYCINPSKWNELRLLWDDFFVGISNKVETDCC